MSENTIVIDSLPVGELFCPPYTITPLGNGENSVEAVSIVFDEDYEGDLSIRIFSLMSEDFHVMIDGEDYAYAIKGARQTDPGFAMLAGPFEKGTVVSARWGKVFAGVYMQDDIEKADDGKTDQIKADESFLLPFVIEGAQTVLYSRENRIILADVPPGQSAVLRPCANVRLAIDGVPVENEKMIASPSEAVYEGFEIRAGDDAFLLAVRNPENRKDPEHGSDAFMNVTGSFAGELCYKTGVGDGEEKGTYHSTRDQQFGIDPFTGYFWGRRDAGDAWSFGLEEGLYAVTVLLGNDAAGFTVTTRGKDKEFKMPEDCPRDNGPTSMVARVRADNGMLTVKGFGSAGDPCPLESIEIRTVTTTAHASDLVPVRMHVPEPAPETVPETVPETACMPPVENVPEKEPENLPPRIRVSVYSRSKSGASCLFPGFGKRNK